MQYASGARFTRDKGCLPGTRQSLLLDICDILNNPSEDAPRVCLLTGLAGSGKSAVAHSIAQLYEEQERLASSFCFSRSDIAERNPSNLWSTIARDLCDHDPQFKSGLWKLIKENRALRMSRSPEEQIEQFIVKASKSLESVGPQLVIVVDALDESGDRDTRRLLLKVLSKQVSDNALPKNLRFLITARPEGDILAAFPSSPYIVHKKMADIPGDTVDRDIERFIRHSLDEHDELDSSWPNGEWCRLLVYHSQRLFQC